MPIPEPDPVNGDIEPFFSETDKEMSERNKEPEDDFSDGSFFAF